eukprot:Opistho-2@77344
MFAACRQLLLLRTPTVFARLPIRKMDASTATSASSSTPLLEFLIIAYDGTDPDAPTRRLAVRQQHLDRARQGKIDGSVVYGGAILGDDGAMIGSSMVVRFPTRAAFDAWLA